jgi:hypothetical protein
MKYKHGILAALLVGAVWLPVGSRALGLSFEPPGQSFASPGAPVGMEGSGAEAVPSLAAFDAPDSSLFADGTRAINEARWADAVRIFSNVASQHGDHADGALYWKAYAEDKLGQPKPSEATCAELRSGYPKSRWIDDCNALEIQLRYKTGKPVQIEPGQSDDVKLLALNAMMRQDEPRALAAIQAILNGDSSERLKKEAQFILGQHYSDATYAQIVRVSYVEGDVRIQRGEPNGKASLGTWEKAVADLPLETGFSLVTGAGRAEVEFENASTLYLGENSVLTFNDLHATAGVPSTELALLSGTVSLHIHPYVAGEKFVLRTPANDLTSKYPDKSYVRVESFTDAMSITPLEGFDVRLQGVSKDAVVPGRTWTYRQGQLWVDENTEDKEQFSAWDEWVANRVAQRDEAIAHVMEASGLTAPIPGMAELDGQGKFFDCAPYGTCWEPKEAAAEDQGTDEETGNRQPEYRKPGGQKAGFVLASFNMSGSPAQAAQSGSTTPVRILEHEFDFPCTPGALSYRTMKDPTTGKVTVIDQEFVARARYDWALCHAGTWIRHRKHYVWVAGGKRHHVEPVRWVKSGHKIGFVPLHPYDVKGQPAINAKHVVFTVNGKSGIVVQPVKFEPNEPIEYLKQAPKEFRNPPLHPLMVAEAPHMEAHPFSKTAPNRGIELSRAAVPIHFDPKSQSFTMPKIETHGGRSTTVFAPITNHSGSLQARGGSFGGGSGFHGGSGSSGGSHGSSGTSGGSHSSGGGSSGGGSSHSGGGSSSVSSASSASSSSAATSSSSSGSHH